MMLLSWLPALPPWEGLHPAAVQFPLALLLVAPLVALVSLPVRPAARPLAFTALGVMLLGTCALWLAAATGHAAGQLVDRTPELQRAISRHEQLGVTARGVFTALTLLYAVLLLVPLWLRRARPLPLPLLTGLHVVFLVVYVTSAGLLAHAANAGGHLVHEFGLRAVVQAPGTPVATPVAAAEPEATDPGR